MAISTNTSSTLNSSLSQYSAPRIASNDFSIDKQEKVHLFIDTNIGLFFSPPLLGANDGVNYVQRAVLIQAFLNLKSGNIEEAEIGFNNALRFGQVNQDQLTISHSLLYLIYVSYVKEDFKSAVGFLENLLSLSNVDPYCTLCGYLYYLEFETEINVNMYKSELKGINQIQLNEVEMLHHTLKQLFTQIEEQYFEKGAKRHSDIGQAPRIESLVNSKFLNILYTSSVSSSKVLFNKIDLNVVDTDSCVKSIWTYILSVTLLAFRRQIRRDNYDG